MSVIDLSQLPAPDVVEDLSYEEILEQRKGKFLALVLETNGEDARDSWARALERDSEPITKLLQENAYRELNLRQRVNDSARARMLAYATDDDLDHIAADYNVERQVIDEGDEDATPPVPPTYESDDSLRLRAQQAWEGLSVAGPRQSYEYHARSADGRVADVSATSPAGAEVVVTVLSTEGDGTASADLLTAVDDALSPDDVRPLADLLTVQSATIVEYAVDATLYVYPGPEQDPILEAAEASLQEYVSQQQRLGRDIRISALHAALHVEGVQRVELASPAADVVLDNTQAAYCTGTTVAIGGSDE
ncbi:Phage-related baseplate assembly protein [Thiohalospira halophila DSM 15071]|uniref:Phage-related baseplate assembly protein n=1 Tax=Thiohalospira halophila DSM 15071 TaxID=1123397 RepID=A0A1I1UBY4_9GAMM|nr:baseplate J/gp47 family protein [Thiohalospira halophila]SFD68135.1 Phage-related baseplate assembly protein [Thiohalospira halophila DSM 15071]